MDWTTGIPPVRRRTSPDDEPWSPPPRDDGWRGEDLIPAKIDPDTMRMRKKADAEG